MYMGYAETVTNSRLRQEQCQVGPMHLLQRKGYNSGKTKNMNLWTRKLDEKKENKLMWA